MSVNPPSPGRAQLGPAFKDALSCPTVAREFFLPDDRASWEGESYSLGQGDRCSILPTISGLRLQEPDPNRVDPYREKIVQEDMVRLVRSLMEVRKTLPLAGTVLSSEVLIGRDASDSRCRRAIFGLTCPVDGRFRGDPDAAAECHRQLTRALTQAGFRPEPASTFDPRTGMKGLAEWAGNVRLRRTARFDRRWLLLGLPLLLLLLLPLTCSPRKESTRGDEKVAGGSGSLFGMEVQTESFLILVDKSASMTPYFERMRAEVRRLLDERLKKGKGKTFANVIVYDGRAASALGKLELLDDAVAGKLGGYLDMMQAGGGTNLAAAMELATQEIKQHGKKTTLLILTDGEDNTLAGLVRDRDRFKQAMGGVEVIANTCTPRLFEGKGDHNPVNRYEQGLVDFSRAYNGRFGPNPER
jgi:hypothetical protein